MRCPGWLSFVALLVSMVPVQGAEKKTAHPQPSSHSTRNIEGWTVHVDDRLLDGADKSVGDVALRVLSNRLYDIALILPADKVERLRRVPIWIDRSCGELNSEQYHPDAGWLRQHGYDPAMAKCVQIPDAASFASAHFQHEQPWAVLHELAHAYHDQVLSFNNPEIEAAWRRFVDSGRYKSVLHLSGRNRPHYGLTDAKEFFAEITEAYFGSNDFFPFNSEELRHEEPELYALMAKIWGPVP
jgi:hypothetical protein